MVTSCAKRQLPRASLRLWKRRSKIINPYGIQKELPFKGPGAFKIASRIILFPYTRVRFKVGFQASETSLIPTDRSKEVLLLWMFFFIWVCLWHIALPVSYSLWSPARKLLASRRFCMLVFLCFCHFPIRCPVWGVVLYCIDSWSLPSSLLFFHSHEYRNTVYCAILLEQIVVGCPLGVPFSYCI